MFGLPTKVRIGGVRELLLGIITMLGLANIGIIVARAQGLAYTPLMRLFDLDQEANIPTWFSSMMLLGCALLSLAVLLTSKLDTRHRYGWRLIVAAFFFLSLDEVALLHEWLMLIPREGFGVEGMLFGSWVLPGLILSVFVIGILSPYTDVLSEASRRTLGFGVLIYMFGVFGMEFVGTAIYDAWGAESVWYFVSSFIEELSEMVGVLTMLWGLLLNVKFFKP